MTELWALLRNPRVSTVGVLLGALAAGFAVMWQAYRSIASTALVPLQIPYVVSGGLVGIAVVGSSLALLSIHVDRVEAAEERRQLAELQREALRRRAPLLKGS